MKQLSRVVWSEGMYLAPHHFQTQSRYFEDALQFATSALWFKAYGLAALKMDIEALRNGSVRLIHACGVFPDGMPFDIPASDAAPEALAVGPLFSPVRESHVVVLAIPEHRPDGPNFQLGGQNGSGGARYVAYSFNYRDENDARDEKAVQIGRKNWQLLLDAAVPPGFTTLPLVRVRRSGSGEFVYDDTFVPPCLDIGASSHLILRLQSLIGALEEKSEALAGPDLRAGQSLTDYYRRDTGTFWFLHTIRSSLPPLHHLLAKRGHPEELYVELARLAGALSSFSLERHPQDIPLYNHDRLNECFDALDLRIRGHLDIIVPSNYVSVPLRQVDASYWVGSIVDERCFESSRWILGVHSPIGEARVIMQVPSVIKVCSERFIGELVRRAVPGMTLTHLPAPPASMPARLESSYFNVTKSGPCWDHIRQTKAVGIFVPEEISSVQLELMVVLEK